MDVIRSAQEIGAELRGARCRAQLTQTQVGKAVGYSASAISRIEAGRMRLEYDRLLALAALLGIPPDTLIGTPVPGRGPVDTVERPADEEDAVRRRNLFTGSLAIGATAALGSSQTSVAAGLVASRAGLEDALLSGLPQCESAPTAVAVQGAVTRARAALEAGAYQELSAALPKQLALATAAVREGHATEGLSALYAIAARVAIKAGDDHLLIVAADRAVQAARDGGHARALAEAHRMVSSGYRRAGRYDRAAQVAVRASDELASARDVPARARASAQGQLLATAAYTAAKGADRSSAMELLARAGAVAGRSADEQTAGGWFGPRQVILHEVSVHQVLSAPDKAVAAARRVDPRGLPLERVARLGLDVARAYNDWGRPEECLRALLSVERVVPQEVRRPGTRALTAGLLFGPGHVPGLREFATRTGALLV
ncbi:helix-turn-helix domain-containing protein [Streptomyces sp. MK37H]|uniref:helix-turn-helix domain-containing protein n=1 Tax=Streptomyces sp. MK37H TaxID=2699117 RepID=UPI001B373FDC|nr:helix-turn-helix transcriptional regulator [Streptomyces sp. MK37H]MBP8536776.1 helix-turn-helix domain-containing protein [Streptomyces sp. MK37H]